MRCFFLFHTLQSKLGKKKQIILNREEVLRRSRLGSEDEGLKQAENRGRALGVTVFCSLFTIIVLLNAWYGRESYAVGILSGISAVISIGLLLAFITTVVG